jgi:hypothetical protein
MTMVWVVTARWRTRCDEHGDERVRLLKVKLLDIYIYIYIYGREKRIYGLWVHSDFWVLEGRWTSKRRKTGSIPVGVKELDCRKNLDFVSRVSKNFDQFQRIEPRKDTGFKEFQRIDEFRFELEDRSWVLQQGRILILVRENEIYMKCDLYINF